MGYSNALTGMTPAYDMNAALKPYEGKEKKAPLDFGKVILGNIASAEQPAENPEFAIFSAGADIDRLSASAQMTDIDPFAEFSEIQELDASVSFEELDELDIPSGEFMLDHSGDLEEELSPLDDDELISDISADEEEIGF